MPTRRRPKGPRGGQFAPGARCEQIEADISFEVPEPQSPNEDLRLTISDLRSEFHDTDRQGNEDTAAQQADTLICWLNAYCELAESGHLEEATDLLIKDFRAAHDGTALRKVIGHAVLGPRQKEFSEALRRTDNIFRDELKRRSPYQ